MDFVSQVIEFNQKVLNLEPKDLAPLDEATADISQECLEEELQEYIDARHTGDFIGQIDALIDGMYFSIGVLYKMGLTENQIRQCMTAVHEANMQKKLGHNARRGDGVVADAVKLEGWVPPEERIGKILGE